MLHLRRKVPLGTYFVLSTVKAFAKRRILYHYGKKGAPATVEVTWQSLDLKTFKIGLFIVYKSNTEVLFVYTTSFTRIQNAINK